MKKIFTFSMLLIAGIVLLAGCTKRHYYDDDNGNDIERGRVVYAPDNYPWFASVDLGDTYAVIETLSDNQDDWPYEEERLTGTFYTGRDNKVYNEDGKFYTYIRVYGFYSTFNGAADAVDDLHRRYDFAKTKMSLRAPNRSIKN